LRNQSDETNEPCQWIRVGDQAHAQAGVLDGMDKAIPWSDLLALIALHAREGRTGRSPFAKEVMLRIHLRHGKSAANSALFSQY
jgi:hypothetical protein